MGIFHCYVSLPEGMFCHNFTSPLFFFSQGTGAHASSRALARRAQGGGEWWRRRSAVRDDMRMVEMQYIYMFTIYLYATSRISMFFLRLSCVLRGMYQSILYITTCSSTIFVDVFWTCLFKIYNNSYHPFFDATLKSSLQIDRVLQQSVSYFDVETWNG